MEQAIDRLRSAGHRVTWPRRAVIRVLQDADDLLEPEVVHQRAASMHPALGLVTVYRTLNLLVGLGLARRVHGQDGCHAYAWSSFEHGHHVICRTCQAAVEFPGEEDLASLVQRVSRQTGFAIDGHMLELLGLCPGCQVKVP
ncbi:MAG TPA: Fur family transcriptional regulator [Anaerolineales bacterium]